MKKANIALEESQACHIRAFQYANRIHLGGTGRQSPSSCKIVKIRFQSRASSHHSDVSMPCKSRQSRNTVDALT